ncbi:E3 ubiquitin-protein ligase CCNB1IP1-like [Vitis vinifera]|uniref:E3 ubiquitin-protein ligase CCNB1IP1-like n=1 Tax=Vitis vinifera TaxID=29760 RepID=A0A438FGU9_VITVI|nr:E3 ubiquitin-protein ligase CCNB1IP1-like [Vitis vinifera]
MRCNACWRELEGRAISTTCGHLLCILVPSPAFYILYIYFIIEIKWCSALHVVSLTAEKGSEDASKILSSDAACPICDQVLSKSLMKPVDVNPNDEWINILTFTADGHGRSISPDILVMKSAYRSVMFYIGQKELEMQYKMNRIVAQCRQKCEMMQEKFTEKLEQVHTAYQKMAKRCQMMEQEIETMSKDKQELQEKFSENPDQLSNPQPISIQDPSLICSLTNPISWITEIQSEKNSSNSGGPFEVSGGSPMKQARISVDAGNRRAGAFGTGAGNPSMTIRNLILSPIKRPQLSRGRPNMFTLGIGGLAPLVTPDSTTQSVSNYFPV